MDIYITPDIEMSDFITAFLNHSIAVLHISNGYYCQNLAYYELPTKDKPVCIHQRNFGIVASEI